MTIPQPPSLPPVMGHRGAKGHAPENTLAGIEKAAALGCRWVEFDVKLTADNHIILMHDDELDRTTDGKGPVAGATLEEIRKLDAGRWFSADLTGEQVPTLDEAMQALAARGMSANIEIKASKGREAETGAAVAKAIAERWMNGSPPPFVSSFSLDSLAAAREVAPQVPRALLTLVFLPGWAAQMAQLGCATFNVLDRLITEKRVRAVREAGYRMLAFTVNDPRRAGDLLSWGVESVITDYPDRMPNG
ncbi:MAG: glycerophosphodiester phosphodiesterase [Alphaproteobacteria bacterium]|nr:glycerophosphodiester phosphodiesterase [Alphaproteobacteria bacterium]